MTDDQRQHIWAHRLGHWWAFPSDAVYGFTIETDWLPIVMHMPAVIANPLWVALGGNGLGQEPAHRLITGPVAALNGRENGQCAHCGIGLCKVPKRLPGRIKIGHCDVKFRHQHFGFGMRFCTFGKLSKPFEPGRGGFIRGEGGKTGREVWMGRQLPGRAQNAACLFDIVLFPMAFGGQ